MEAIIFVVGVFVSFMVMGGFLFAVYSEFDTEFNKKRTNNP
jgi:hypothetical protein